MARAVFANLGVAVMVLAAWSACGRTKPPPAAGGSGGAAGASAGTGSGGTPGSGGAGIGGSGGGGVGQDGATDTEGGGGAGGLTSVDAGVDGPLPVCPFTSIACPSGAEGFQCVYPVTPSCQMCIEGSRLRRPDEIITSVPLFCTCTGGSVRCAGGLPPLIPSVVGDCHLELPLTCAEAAGWFVDSFCQEPAPCTP